MSKKMRIAIPSYQRPKILQEQTLKYLNLQKVDNSLVDIFVRDSDECLPDYLTLEEEGYTIIQCDAVGAGMKHNFITTHYPEDTWIVELDDDIRTLKNTRKEDIEFMKEMDEMRLIMEEEGINYGGIYSCDNDFFMGTQPRFTRDLRYMLGIVRVRCIKKDIVVKTNYAEDFEFILRYFMRDGKILKNNHIGPRTKLYNIGGNDASGRNQETERLDKVTINEEFPNHSRLFQRKNGRWDLRIKSYKVGPSPQNKICKVVNDS
jgi:hypothetical protein